jgi:hypothetical protein
MSKIKLALYSLVFILISILVTPVLATQKVVFVVNTKEHDIRGAVTATYLDEYADTQNWQKLYPQAKVIRIRATTTSELTKMLEVWMDPRIGEPKEVQGLFIRSHGEPMRLFNEPETFNVRMPEDISTVFSPIIGRFAPNARIVFNGCEIVKDLSADEAALALRKVTQAFGVTSGSIYANRTLGFESWEAYQRVELTNKDVPILQRTSAGLFYVAWPITVPMILAMEKSLNRGYLMKFGPAGDSISKTTYFESLK